MQHPLSEADFTALIERNQARLQRICRVYAQDRDDQADLFQEIVYQLWQALPRFRAEAQVDTFIYRVGLNTALTHVRRARRQPIASDDLSRHDRGHQPDWDQDLDQQQQLKALYQAIDQLPKADRTLVLLYLEDLSYQEMADITGLSVNYVGVRLNRIKKKLAKTVDSEG